MARSHWDSYAVQVAREMGYQWRRRYLGEYKGDRIPPGHASRSVLGKIQEEGFDGAGQTRAAQFFPEFYTGDALLGRRALQALNDVERTAITFHFYPRGVPVKLKAHTLGWPTRTYWWRLNRGMEKLGRALRSDCTNLHCT
jgi:DNA-directed RNA polymerase specialized sigma24 family protein